jgi:predicted ATPase with chaperone activity
VEADVVASSSHKPDIKVVGLADKATQESISRIQAALRNSPGAPGLAGLRRGPLGKLGA